MSLALTANTLALGNGLTTFFGGTGGTEPYAYEVLPGGVGGTIDPTSGLYTAPATGNGTDTVQVTDDDDNTATAVMLVGPPLLLFCDIIRKEMGLGSDQVYLWDQKINIPKDERLYIAVSTALCKPFGNTISFDSDVEDLDGVQSLNMLARLDVNILSRGPAARDRKEEVLLALMSVYSEQQQNANSFSIARLSSSFLNLSDIDGSAIPYRFVISVNVQYAFKLTKAVPFFDDFDDASVEQVEP